MILVCIDCGSRTTRHDRSAAVAKRLCSRCRKARELSRIENIRPTPKPDAYNLVIGPFVFRPASSKVSG